MFQWSSRLIILAMCVAAIAPAQMASRNQKVDAYRVGSRLACQCGCSDTVATCSMLGCGFSHPAKEKIAQMQLVTEKALHCTNERIFSRRCDGQEIADGTIDRKS